MAHQIHTVYVVHHAHTDIGYTDLQERVIDTHIDYIRSVVRMMHDPELASFRWNCETLFCVEAFLREASDEEKEAFLSYARKGQIGISANYLNFNDLVDTQIYARRLSTLRHLLPLKTAMMADINGLSMGYRDAMLDNGVEFLYANVHCHHGMYPIFQNQTAFFWENKKGQRLLVWNGEHYHLGNVLGMQPSRGSNFMMENHIGKTECYGDAADELHRRLSDYLDLCVREGYPYDFIPISVSGVFSDNAPPSPDILHTLRACQERYPDIQLKMVSLQELYEAISPSLSQAPVYRGDWTDWWANGAGSTPYAVKHYLEARRLYHLCERLDPEGRQMDPALRQMAEDNLFLYAEHTWGHSSTITNPYDTMVLNLDIRKTSYASKAHEAASRMLNRISIAHGDMLRYYHTTGDIRAISADSCPGEHVVEFYLESPHIQNAMVTGRDGKAITCQVSRHPRGHKITFTDSFLPHEEKEYHFQELPAKQQILNSRKCYVGAERIADIVSQYDPDTYRLPYEVETADFRLCYSIHQGITALIDKKTGQNLCGKGPAPLFTPLYEVTPAPDMNDARRVMGRNIRGQDATLHTGRLEKVTCLERGDVFTEIRLDYSLPGTEHTDVILRLYRSIPRIDFRLRTAKTLSSDIESIFLPLTLNLPGVELFLRKGTEAFRPGVDQIPGTCMEFYLSEDGLAYCSEKAAYLIACRDAPLLYMGEMRHHPIVLCDGQEKNNRRDICSWVMNNNWETNFKMDLSGFGEYAYTLWRTDPGAPDALMDRLHDKQFDPHVMVIA